MYGALIIEIFVGNGEHAGPLIFVGHIIFGEEKYFRI